jgi:prepilin-type N-terminal cleavage/methylation domain-containing protein
MLLRRLPTRAAGRTARAGFTLAELLAVVAILAILAGVAIPTYIALIGNQRVRVAKTEAKKFSAMISTFAANHIEDFPGTDGYPAQSGGLEFLVQDNMIATLPVDPWGRPFFFELVPGPTGANIPVVISGGPDGNSPIRSDQP